MICHQTFMFSVNLRPSTSYCFKCFVCLFVCLFLFVCFLINTNHAFFPFSLAGHTGITVVGHDIETENIPVNNHEEPGSFILEPRYGNDITMQQLGALADVSLECEQYVKVGMVLVGTCTRKIKILR